MELVFHKDNGLYITEFEVTSDFNVHLERSKGGKVSFYQKTTDGNYDHIEKLSKNIDKVFDYDFQALVYPKIIKITSECEFDVASLTTDGEVTEIKSQSKEVEITANGVTEIAPDAGFGYLSGVKVNVNVPQSGGSGGTEGGMKLLCFNSFAEGLTGQDLLGFLGPFNALVKVVDSEGKEGILPLSVVDRSLIVKSIAVVEGLKTVLDHGNEVVVSRQLIESVGGDLSPFIITKEQFYAI